MSATIVDDECRRTEVIEVTTWITGVDSEVPITTVPVKWTIEIEGVEVTVVLPVEQDITQILIPLSPVCAVKVIIVVYAHQII